MPKIVNHEARRAELVDACWRVIASQGITNATTREIAREAGVAHGILAHYFPDKDAILREVLKRSYEALRDRIAARMGGLSGAAALRSVLTEALPTDAAARQGEQVELAFWGRAVGDPDLAAEQWGSYREWHALVRELVTAAHRLGELPGATDPTSVANALVALVDGLGAEVALYPSRFPARQQIRIIDSVLAAYGMDVVAARRAGRKPAPTS